MIVPPGAKMKSFARRSDSPTAFGSGIGELLHPFAVTLEALAVVLEELGVGIADAVDLRHLLRRRGDQHLALRRILLDGDHRVDRVAGIQLLRFQFLLLIS